MAGKCYPIEPGDIFVFNNIHPRSLTRVDGPETLVLEQCLIPPAVCTLFADCTSVFYESYRLGTVRIGGDAPLRHKIQEDFALLFREVRGEDPYRHVMVGAHMLRLLADVARNHILSTGTNTDAHPLPQSTMAVFRAMQAVCRGIADPTLCVEGLARAHGYSAAYLTRLFRQYTDMTVTEYIRLIRIQNVVQLLQNEKCNVLDAAMACGFSSAAGFYKTFRRATGVPGSEKRRFYE